MRERFIESSPYNFFVIDDFFGESNAAELYSTLLNYNGWREKKIDRDILTSPWVAEQLFANTNYIPEVLDISKWLLLKLGLSFGISKLNNSWSIISSRVDDFFPHCDGGSFSVNWWYSTEFTTFEGSTGGLALYSVKRSPEMSPEEYGSYKGGCKTYVSNKSIAAPIHIPYRNDRTIFFDARTFHSTIPFGQSSNKDCQKRLNLTFTFD